MRNNILTILALLFAVLIFFLYINRTWNGSIASLRQNLAQDKQALTAATDYGTREKTLQAQQDSMDPAAVADLEQMLPDSVDNVGLILDLDALAARSGLTLTGIDVAQDAADQSAADAQGTQSPVGSVDLSVSAKGSYAALLAFLGGVEKSLRLLDVQNLSVSGSDTGVYTYTMSIRLYWLR